MRPLLRLVPLLLLISACGSSVRVAYDRERCLVDGQPATLERVETEQSRIAAHVLARQPVQTAITVLMLLLASAGYLDKLALLIAARLSSAPSFAERVRTALERHRPHPVRYFGIVSTGLVLVGLAAGTYVYLDADKRASERELQQLQFCHLALKGAAEQAALDEQRLNLDQLRSTAGSIKDLVDSLPPAEQEKAAALLGKVRISLGNQERMLSRQNAMAAAVASGSMEIEKSLGAVATGISGLKGLPEQIHAANEALARLDLRMRLDQAGQAGQPAPANLGAALAEARHSTDVLGDRIQQIDCAKARLPSGKTVGEALADLAARPAPVCHCDYPSAPPIEGAARKPQSAAKEPADPAPKKPPPSVTQTGAP